MGRKILAVIVAMITAIAIIWLFEMISTMTAPDYPKNAAYFTQAELMEYIRSMPATAFVLIFGGYVIASFAGGFVATKMGRRWSSGATLALIVGVLLSIGGVLNFFVVLPGQPMWFIIASMLSYIPFSLLGYRVAR